MRIVLLLILVGCSKGTSCPTVDELARHVGSAAERREVEIVIERCRADGWSESVTRCLGNVKNNDMIDPCLDKLTADQKKHLDESFAPIIAEYVAKELSDVREHDVAFESKLADLHLDQLTARAAQCADFVAAIDRARKATLACTSSKSILLEQFGMQQRIIAEAKELAKTANADLAAACIQLASTLRENAGHVCDP